MKRLSLAIASVLLVIGMVVSCAAPTAVPTTTPTEAPRNTVAVATVALPSSTPPVHSPTLATTTRRPSPSPTNAIPVDTPIPVLPTLTLMPNPIATPARGTGGLPWWNDRVFYELFVRSFQDRIGDGNGDLQGLISRLDYLNDGDADTDTDLGITGLWLMPVTQAVSYHGYDVIDYDIIERDYGNNDDFRELISEAHRRGIAVIIDLVLNHTSDQHPWFVDSQIPGSPHEGWYVWSGDPPALRGLSGGSARHPLGDRYYLGLFGSGMPDLNYLDGGVTSAMRDVIRFWLEDMGVDGFRLDAMRHLIEQDSIVANTPATHDWLRDYHRYVQTLAPDAISVGEAWDSTRMAASYVADQVDLVFEFELASAILNSVGRGYYQTLGQTQKAVLAAYPQGQYAAFLSNHDQNRVMDMVLDDVEGAKVAAILLLTNPGVPFIYYGEEIGMTGAKPDEKIRTPMQWDGTVNAGFSTGTPWEALNPGYESLNVAAESVDTESLLALYRTLIRLRGRYPALRAGHMTLLDTGNQRVYAYLRSGFAESLLVVVNLSDEPVSDYALSIPDDLGLEGTSMLRMVGSPATEPSVPERMEDGSFRPYAPYSTLPPHSYLIARFN